MGGDSSQPAEPTIPTPTAPVTPNSSATRDTEQALYRQQLRRKSISSTMYAGATGGYQGPTNAKGQTGPGQAGAAPSVGTGGTKTG